MYDYEQRLKAAKEVILDADYILIGGGSGLSAAAGLTYSGKRFTDNFADFIEKYGLEDMYTASFYPFKTDEELWAHWARHIDVNRFSQPETQLYRDLLVLMQDKPYFVLTTNVESQFAKAGFPQEKIFATQGDYAYLQCAKGCHDRLSKITKAYNLPSRYVLHTVGPIVHGALTGADREALANCYRSCLALAASEGLKSVAFCCISTGEFHFPKEKAAEIAVETVCGFLANGVDMKVIFNVFKDEDMTIYQSLL